MKYRVKCRQVAVDVGQHCDAHQDPSRFRSDDSRLFILNLRRPQHPAQRLFDEPDYLLRVITRRPARLPGTLRERLATLPGIQRLS
jgi:hypothetical protein